jgi:hypothetical protein
MLTVPIQPHDRPGPEPRGPHRLVLRRPRGALPTRPVQLFDGHQPGNPRGGVPGRRLRHMVRRQVAPRPRLPPLASESGIQYQQRRLAGRLPGSPRRMRSSA